MAREPWICDHVKQVLVAPGKQLDADHVLADLIFVLPCPVPLCASGVDKEKMVAGDGVTTYARVRKPDGWRWEVQFT